MLRLQGLRYYVTLDARRRPPPPEGVHVDYALDLKVMIKFKTITRMRSMRCWITRASVSKPRTANTMCGRASRSCRRSSRGCMPRPTRAAQGVGYLFNLTGHPRVDQNQEHLILAAQYQLEYS